VSDKISCAFCEEPMAASEAEYLSGSKVCSRCYRGGFVEALERRGVRFQEMRHEWRTTSSEVTVFDTDIVAALEYDLGLEVEFARENFLVKVFKHRDEIQTGDPAFDKAVLIKTDRREAVAELLSDPDVRESVADLLPLFSAYGNLCIKDNRCRLGCSLGSATVPSPFEAKRAMAALFNHLQRYASRKGLPGRPGSSSLPDLSVLRRLKKKFAAVEAVRFHHMTFEHLGALSPLDALFRESRAPRLDLVECKVRSGDFSPLAGISNLHTLSLEGTVVADLGSFMGLKSLSVLRMDGSSLDPAQVDELKARLTGLTLELLP